MCLPQAMPVCECVCVRVLCVLCVSLGTGSFVGRLATSKAASHDTAGDRDLAGL